MNAGRPVPGKDQPRGKKLRATDTDVADQTWFLSQSRSADTRLTVLALVLWRHASGMVASQIKQITDMVRPVWDGSRTSHGLGGHLYHRGAWGREHGWGGEGRGEGTDGSGEGRAGERDVEGEVSRSRLFQMPTNQETSQGPVGRNTGKSRSEQKTRGTLHLYLKYSLATTCVYIYTERAERDRNRDTETDTVTDTDRDLLRCVIICQEHACMTASLHEYHVHGSPIAS